MSRASQAIRRRTAMALLVVLVLVMMAALSAYGFTFYMESQYRSSRMHEEQVYARQAALNATELVAAILELPPQKRAALGGLENNPGLFRDRVLEAQLTARLTDDNSRSWRASVIAPRLDDDGSVSSPSAVASDVQREYLFGLENESAKIPLRDLLQWNQRLPGHAKQVLLGLPGATESMVNAYLEELSLQLAVSDSASTGNANRNTIRSTSQAIGSNGSSSSGASLNSSSGSSLNGSSTVNQSDRLLMREQLQLLWLGGDLNQNYRIDALDAAWSSNQANGQGLGSGLSNALGSGSSFSSAQAGMSNRQTSVAGQAWQRYLTWCSGARNESHSGLPRVDLNQPDLRGLHQQLLKIWPAEWADFVVLFRQYGAVPSAGPGGKSTSAEVASPTAVQPDFSVPPTRTILSPLELVGAVVPIPAPGGSSSDKSRNRQAFSPFQPEVTQMGNYLGKLLDDVSADIVPSGRIDINSASLPVMMAIPGMDRQLAEAIVQRRESRASGGAAGAVDSTIAWLLLDGVVDFQRLIALEPYMTGRSDVYSCQVVGYRDDQSAVYRCTLTIDARQRPAVKRNIQTWHSWDRGFSTTEFSSRR